MLDANNSDLKIEENNNDNGNSKLNTFCLDLDELPKSCLN